jgi:signal transduction histidine kinase
VGTENGGLNIMRPSTVIMVEPPDHWMNQPIFTVASENQGGLFAGTEGAAVYHYDHGLFSGLSRIRGRSSAAICSLCEDSKNTLWVGTRGAGLWRESQGAYLPVAPTAAFPKQISAIFESRSGGLWFGTENGPVQYRNDRWFYPATNAGLAHPDTRCFAEGPDGAIWFGMQGGGLGRLVDGKVSRFEPGVGLACDSVWSLLAETDGTLWVGTFGGGLCRYKSGKFSTISSSNGLPSNVICSILDDQNGNFWMSSYAGVFRAKKATLNQCAEGKAKLVDCLAFGLADGLTRLELSGGCQPAACRTANGVLWFPSSEGLAMIDPKTVRDDALPPPVTVERVLMDGEQVFPKDSSSPREKASQPTAVQIGPGGRHVEMQYAGLSFTSPEQVHYRYCMEGLEKDWVDAGNRRSAYYSFLPPGKYVFRVLACNSSGVWNETGASLKVVVMPYFWQTWWFLCGIGLGAMGIVALTTAGIFHRRERQKREKLERQQASEQERTRIARDIHDQLGIGLTRISMLSLSVTSQDAPSSKARQRIQEIHQTTSELTRSMDEIVWVINPRHDTLDSLLMYLAETARTFLETAAIRCRLNLPIDVPSVTLSAEARHHIFLSFQEILNNIVKHASASEVRIDAELPNSDLVISVEDNGKGFVVDEPGKPGPTGDGLSNVKQRLRQMGGQFICESRLGTGTKIRLIFPLT